MHTLLARPTYTEMRRLDRLRGCACRCRCFSTGSSRRQHATASHDPYNAFTWRAEEQAIDGQKSKDATATSSSSRGPDSKQDTEPPLDLRDLRVSIKENFATRDGPTGCSSAILDGYTSPYDATVVERLRSHGARIVGKTNMDEFGMGSYGIHSRHGPVRNPLDIQRVAGGSSSGAAASVAAGLCDACVEKELSLSAKQMLLSRE